MANDRQRRRAQVREEAFNFGYKAGYEGRTRNYVKHVFTDPKQRGDMYESDVDHALYGYNQGEGVKAREDWLASPEYAREQAEAKRVEDEAAAAIERVRKWRHRFMQLAEHVASWSKDPSTCVGAVIVLGDCVVATGYNGYPRAMADVNLDDRDNKLSRTVHAEMNALLNALRHGVDVRGATMYTTFPPCDRCAAHLIQAGVMDVVTRPLPEPYKYPKPGEVESNKELKTKLKRWRPSAEAGLNMFTECGGNYTTFHVWGEGE